MSFACHELFISPTAGTHPIRRIAGRDCLVTFHSDVQITLNVYDHPETENFRAPLGQVADQLLRDVMKSANSN
jgi:hypothetical protein